MLRSAAWAMGLLFVSIVSANAMVVPSVTLEGFSDTYTPTPTLLTGSESFPGSGNFLIEDDDDVLGAEDSVTLTNITLQESGPSGIRSALVTFTLVDPQTHIPQNPATWKAGQSTGTFNFANVGGVWTGSFLIEAVSALSNIKVDFGVVPLPAAAWLFISAIGGLFGWRRWQGRRATGPVPA